MIIDMAPDAKIRKVREEIVAKARHRISDYLYPQISEEVAGRRRLIDQPPALFHITKELEAEHEVIVHEALEDYRLSLPDERRILFERYSLDDIVVKRLVLAAWAHAVLSDCFSPQRITRCCCNSKKLVPLCLNPTRARACMTIMGYVLSLGND